MKNKKVAVLYGGMSEEREVSLRSGQAVYDALVRLGYETVLIDMDRDVALKIKESGAGVCFIALHGTYGEDGRIQGLLDIMGIPYTGSSYQANLIAFDKVISKEVFVKAGVETPEYVVLDEPNEMMPYEGCVIKPARQGSSVGIHIVSDYHEYHSKVEDAFKYDSKVLVEEQIKGKELTLGILGDEVLPAIWIKPKKGVYDYESKYTKGMTEYIFETGLNEEQTEIMNSMAKKAYDALECSGYGRVDIMFDGHIPYVLEVNTLPGMTETSLFPKASNEAGYSFDEMVEKMLLGALK